MAGKVNRRTKRPVKNFTAGDWSQVFDCAMHLLTQACTKSPDGDYLRQSALKILQDLEAQTPKKGP